MLGLGGALIVSCLTRRGFSARDEPTALEGFIARRLRHAGVPGAVRNMQNPVPLTDEVLSEARAHFADHCALCHGNDGKGQSDIGRSLYPKAPDMTASATQSLSDGEIFYIIKNGIRLTGMPAWGENTPEDDAASWKLVHFIRHLPGITAQDLREMNSLNPKSPDEFREEEAQRQFLEEGKTTEPQPQPRPSTHHH